MSPRPFHSLLPSDAGAEIGYASEQLGQPPPPFENMIWRSGNVGLEVNLSLNAGGQSGAYGWFAVRNLPGSAALADVG